MHTIDLLEQAIALAASSGLEVRQDWFGGAAAGLCELKGRPVLFIDLALSPAEQLDQVLEALGGLPAAAREQASPPLLALLGRAKAA